MLLKRWSVIFTNLMEDVFILSYLSHIFRYCLSNWASLTVPSVSYCLLPPPWRRLCFSRLHPLFLCFGSFVCMPFGSGAYLWDALQGYISLFIISRVSIARPPREPEHPAILSSTPDLGWTRLSCGRSGCWQINYILANIGSKDSIPIMNQYSSLGNKLMYVSIVY